MAIGDKIKKLRQDRDWSQDELAKRIGIHQKQISMYERNMHHPSVEALIKIANFFDVSLDYLAFESRTDSQSLHLADLELIEKLKEIDSLSEKDKKTVKEVLDAFILKNRFQNLATKV